MLLERSDTVRRIGAVISSVLLLLPFILAAQDAPNASTDKARVVVCRCRQFEGGGSRPSIYCNETDVARVQAGRYVALGLAPGKYSFRSVAQQSQIELDLKPGQEYYIRLDIVVGELFGHVRLTLVQPEQGIGEVKQMKPADAGMVKDKRFLAADFVPTR